MKLSLDWLSDFIAFTEKDPLKIAEKLTLGVAEVERIEVQGALLSHCVVGKVLTIEKHPNADALFLCDVQTDQGKKHVVCGGTNLRVGMLVAFAHIGARVRWHGEEMMELQETKIRGEQSEGMICAAEELDLTEKFPEAHGHNIIDLGNEGYDVGTPLKEALRLHDVIFHIDNHAITHRPDLFSHIGFARECTALRLGTWKQKPVYTFPLFSTQALPFRCVLKEKDIVPRYAACMLHIEGIGETPDWMVRRLEAVGWRSLNLPIDITNYVASEVGMPLHSFDADDLHGDIHIRRSRKGEHMRTLDEVERSLPEGVAVLSDDEGIFDLLGIMGGLRSATKDVTRNIYLHAAIVNPVMIRKAVVALGHRTEAATVYEKGVPPIAVPQGLARALELFLRHVPGARIVSELETFGEDGNAPSLSLSISKVTKFLGKETSTQEVETILSALDFSLAKGKEDVLVVTPPLHRLGDIHEPRDLVEEIARITGFEAFAPELPIASITPPPRDHRLNHIRNVLKEGGCIELVQFSFLGEKLLKEAGMEDAAIDALSNSLGEDMKYMRPSLMPRLLEFASLHLEQADEALRLFEVGHLFLPQGEEQTLSILIAEKRVRGVKEEPFLLTKSLLREVFQALTFPCTFERLTTFPSWAHPARGMCISLEKEQIGEFYEMHPVITKRCGFPSRVVIASLSLQKLLSRRKTEKLYQEISLFPSITYDTTVSLQQTMEVGKVLKKIQGAHPLLREIMLIDLFQKKGGERQLTFRCVYAASDRTLREEEVQPVHEKVETMLRGA